MDKRREELRDKIKRGGKRQLLDAKREGKEG